MSNLIPAEVLGQLREALVGLKTTRVYSQIVEPRDSVFARYQPVFSPEHALEITAEEMRSFLLLDNNRHWSGLHRQGSRMCSDMSQLRKAIALLVDESQPVELRLDQAIQMVSGMGKNIATAILLISQPTRYGVWNNRSELIMKKLGIWPRFEHGEPFGSRYTKVNKVLLEARDHLQTDLWTLDAVWWYLDEHDAPVEPEIEGSGIASNESEQGEHRFGLERHLHDFLRDNWEHTELGKDWEIYKEPGDEEAGYEYPCAVGKIDLLAKHKSHPRWLVIELKRNQTSDQTVGQILRYIGWVKQHLAQQGEEVDGMIIGRQADDSLRYALSTIQNVELRLYQVRFYLQPPNN